MQTKLRMVGFIDNAGSSPVSNYTLKYRYQMYYFFDSKQY